jgi:AraC-like DNA-binding protein
MPRSERVELVSFGSPRFRSVESGGLLVTSAVFPANTRLCPHVHERTCVAMTLAGAFDSGMRRRSYWSTPSMVVTEPAAERHDNRFSTSGAHIVIVQPDGRLVERMRPFSRFLDSINHFADAHLGLLARRLGVEVERPDAVTPLAVEAIALELLAIGARCATLRETSSSPPAWLTRVRDHLHDAFAEVVTLDALAVMAGVHPGHLTRVFRRYYGRSIGAYQRDVRLEWAGHQLTTSADPLAAIASAAGFADQSHFTRAFRRRFGCSPGAWRARAASTPAAKGPKDRRLTHPPGE